MLKILTTSVFMCCFYSLTAQEDSIPNLNFNTHEEIRIYKTMIFLNNNKRVIHGILYEVDDSSILISNSLIKEDYLNGRFQLAEINYNNIDHLQIKNTPIIRRSVLIGTITGFVIGAIYWYNQGDGAGGFEYFSAESMAILGGIPLGALGAGIGSFYGVLKFNIPIKGNRTSFNNSKHTLKKFTIK